MGIDINKKRLPVGTSFFEKLIEEEYYYVDKTLFVKELMDKGAEVTLCTRPRRFGKTLNLTMLKSFFEDTARLGGKDTRSLFRGLKIEEAGERYMERQGKYPVIYLSFKEAKAENFKETCDIFKDMFSVEFRRHGYVKEKIGDAIDLKKFEGFSSGDGDISSYKDSLKFLSKCLEAYYGKKVVILIDEYDVPLENAWSCPARFYDEMVGFIRPLLSGALKDNPHLQLAVMTGCLRVSKESIFTGLNNLDVISILNNSYSEHFGFTQNEMDAMLKYYGLEDKGDTLRDWYNGYLFGKTTVYNPWSSVRIVRDWGDDKDANPMPYWVNTSSNSVVHDLMDRANASMKTDLETLLADGTISKTIHEDITYKEIDDDAENLWNFLFFTGYLKKVAESVDRRGRIILDMKIPNKELQIIFEDKILEWFKKRIAGRNLDALHNAVLSGDAETFRNELSACLSGSISYMDTEESLYHGLMVGVLLGIDGYRVKSNRESGDGRSDLVLYSENGNNGKAVIFEFKVVSKAKMLPQACEDALKQIEDKNYAAYWDEEDYKDIIKYGIGFYKKRCEVRKG